MNEAELAAQIRLAAVGDVDALQRLIVHYHATLHRKVAGLLNPALARRLDPDDVLQQAYVSAFKSLTHPSREREREPSDPNAQRQQAPACPNAPRRPAPSFDSPAGFYKWLERIALNELKNARRDLQRRKRDVRRELPAGADACTSYPDLLHRLTASDTTPSGHLAQGDAAAAVLSCLARLTEDQRAAVRMRFLEARPVPEVAAALGKTDEAIHALCYRALKELRTLLVSVSRYLSRP